MEKIKLICSNCGHENRPDRNYCSNCGSELIIICPVCRSSNKPGDRYCGECGKPLTEFSQSAVQQDLRLKTPAHLAAKIIRDRSVLEGERRIVTVLFADAAGFTPISENLNEEQLYRLMQDFVDRMIESIHQFEGTVTQFLGDGIMAIFGAPVAHEDSAKRAVSASLTMQKTLEEYSKEVKELLSIECHFRVGLNTGPVVVGKISDTLNMDFTALGDTVNLAARMEQIAEPGTVYLTENTRRHVQNYFELQSLGKKRIKGKSNPIDVYRVIREKPARSRLEAAAEHGLTPFIGREQELSVLVDHLEQTRKGRGKVVFISGEAGIGKSRLLLEFRKSIADEHVSWLKGSCNSFGKNIPYLPVIEIVKNNLGIEDQDNDSDIINKINNGTQSWEHTVRSTIPYLRFLLNVDPGDPVVMRMDAMERRVHIFDSLRALLIQESRKRPVVVIVEDLHWVDEQSEAALTAFVELVVTVPVLLIFTYRPGYVSSLGDRSYFHRITLNHITPDKSGLLIEGILKTSNLPQQVRQLILSKAEGNPFYIEEVTKSLLESGVMDKSNGTYILNKPAEEIQVPDTIQDVILSRIDRLPKQAREALQLASVIGREFSVRLLNRISDIELRLDDMLEELRLLELIYQKEYFPELSYMFKHALTHDVAYYTLLTERRKKLHRIIGEAIEELYSDHLPDHFEMLAHHYLEGENWEKTLTYLVKAGQKAEAVFANRDALKYYLKALDVCNKTGRSGIETSVDLLQMKGMLNFTVGNYTDAINDFKNMCMIAQRLDNVHLAGLALAFQAWAEWWNHDFDTAEVTAKSALSIAREGYDDVAFFASSTLGLMFYGIHRSVEAEPYLRKAEELAPLIDNNFIKSWYSIVGWHQSQWEGKYDETIQHLARWRNSLEETNSIFLILGDRWLQAVTLASKGDYNRAMDLLKGVISTSDRVGGIPFWHARTLNTIGYVYGELQDLKNAIEWNSRGVEAAIKAQFDDPEVENNARLNLGDNHMDMGNLDEAQEQYRKVELVVRNPKLPERLDLWRYAQHLFHSHGELCLKRGESDKALNYANECLSLAEPGKSRKYIIKGRRLRGQVYMMQGKLRESEKEFLSALEIAREVGNPPQLWKTFVALGNLKQLQGKTNESQNAYRNALKVIEAVAEKLEDRQLRETFLNADQVSEIRQMIGQ